MTLLTVEFPLNAENGNASFTYNFGDGSSIDLVSAKIFSHIYLNAGFYKLMVQASSNTPGSYPVSDSKYVQVETPPNGNEVDVPNVIETEVEYNFTVSIVEGNNMTLVVDVSIGATAIPGFSVSLPLIAGRCRFA